jgi:hypothetical protein
MAGVLGVNCKKDEIFLALAEGGSVVDSTVEKISAPALLEETERLQAIFDDVTRALTEIEPEEVRILMPEQTYKDSYLRIAPRAALETLVRIAAHGAGVEVEMLHRNSARSRLGMPRSGKFDRHIPATVGDPVGRYWNAGRNLAAAAALAED